MVLRQRDTLLSTDDTNKVWAIPSYAIGSGS